MFKAADIGDGHVSVDHAAGNSILVSPSQARRMGLRTGLWELLPAAENERGCWLLRTKSGRDVIVSKRKPGELGYGLIRSFCWSIFSKTTGLELEPGQFAKYKLKETHANQTRHQRKPSQA